MEKTISCFSSFVYLENFLCINRSYLLNQRNRIFGNIISFLVLSAVIISYVYDIFEVDIDETMYQGILTFELLLLVAAAYRKVAIKALDRLDEKCSVDKSYTILLKKKVEKETLIAIASIAVDVVGMYILEAKLSAIFSYAVIFAAHEAETVFIALIIESMNLRLLKLSELNPYAGSRVYRHVLMTSSQISMEFTTKVLIMLGVVLLTTISYSCTVLLMYSEKGMTVAAYLLWRELKSLYCLQRICRATSNSERICQQLAFQLARKLAFDRAFDKAKRPEAHATLKRWYNTVLRHRPRYVRGSVLSIGLSTPLHLLDLSVNYVLIIIQIYVAYK